MERLCKFYILLGSQIGPALDALLERSHDFTDSPYTSHEHRQKILVLLDSLADRVSHLIEAVSLQKYKR